MKGACVANVALFLPSFFLATRYPIVKLLLVVRFNLVTYSPTLTAHADFFSASVLEHWGVRVSDQSEANS